MRYVKKLKTLFSLPFFTARFVLYACLLFFVFSDLSRAEDITLAWDSSSGNIDGYIIFYAEQSVLTNPSTQINAGNVVQYTVTNLTPGHTYYFAVKAYNSSEQSPFSNEIFFTVPGGSASTTTITGGGVTTTVPGGKTTTTTVSTTTSKPGTGTTTTVPKGTATTSISNTGGSSSGGAASSTTTIGFGTSTTTSAAVNTSTTTTVSLGPLDSDQDGLPDDKELVYGTDPNNADTDGDGLRDGEELGYWGDKWNEDSDGDGLINILDSDSDNDGFLDGLEVAQGTSPTDSNSKPVISQNFIVGLGQYPSNDSSIEVFKENYRPAFKLAVDWYEYNVLNGEVRIATGDIDGDKKEEVVIGLAPVEGEPEIPGGKFEILDDNFQRLTWGQIDWPEYNSLNGESWPACGDIDGDGRDEILIGLGVGGNGKVEVFDYDDNKLKHKSWLEVGWTDYAKAGGGVRPACGNLNFDRRDEIVLGLYQVNNYFMSSGKFEILDNGGKHLAWGQIDWPEYIALNGEIWPACGDTSQNIKDEIIIGLGRYGEGKICVLNYALGQVLEKKWLEAGTDEYKGAVGETHVFCADIDLDYKDELLVGFGEGGNGFIQILDDASTEYALINSLQTSNEDYNQSKGATYPAFKGMVNEIPWLLEVLFKTRAYKIMNQ